MRTNKDYWTPVIKEFERMYPELAEKVVDWYPSAQMEVTVKTSDGKKYAYDWMNKIAMLVYDNNSNDDFTEEYMRRKFARALERKMNNVGISQDTLAYRSGISAVTINRYANAKATPSTFNLMRIAKVFKCNVNELLNWDDAYEDYTE